MTHNEATGDLLARVRLGSAPVGASLYYQRGVYRILVGSGIGWAPEHWKDRATAMHRLLAMQSYGAQELAMLKVICG